MSEEINLDNSDNSELTPETLQEKLRAYHKSFQEEFAKPANEINEDSEAIANKAKEVLIKCIPDAAATLAYLCNFAESATIRLQAAKYIMDNGLGKTGFATPADPLEELVKQLTANASKGTTSDQPSS
jgi:hypothetical protein